MVERIQKALESVKFSISTAIGKVMIALYAGDRRIPVP
jgi:hypothetical protein